MLSKECSWGSALLICHITFGARPDTKLVSESFHCKVQDYHTKLFLADPKQDSILQLPLNPGNTSIFSETTTTTHSVLSPTNLTDTTTTSTLPSVPSIFSDRSTLYYTNTPSLPVHIARSTFVDSALMNTIATIPLQSGSNDPKSYAEALSITPGRGSVDRGLGSREGIYSSHQSGQFDNLQSVTT